MSVILTTPEEVNSWMTAPTEIALQLQRPLPDQALTQALTIVARGERKDGASEIAA
jgi:hypothetical protein